MKDTTHEFCKLLARKICKENKVRITYLYVEPKNLNDSHWRIHGDSEMNDFTHSCQACCKYSAIFDTVRAYIKEKEKE